MGEWRSVSPNTAKRTIALHKTFCEFTEKRTHRFRSTMIARAATAIATAIVTTTGDCKSHRIRGIAAFSTFLTNHHFLDWETVQIEKKKKNKKRERKRNNQITHETVVWQFIDLDGSNAINMLPLNLRLISKLFNNLLIHPRSRFHAIHGLKRLKRHDAIRPINSIRLDEPAFYGKQKN